MCISCRPHVDVHKGEGTSGSCGRMWTEEIFCVDLINGWPLPNLLLWARYFIHCIIYYIDDSMLERGITRKELGQELGIDRKNQE